MTLGILHPLRGFARSVELVNEAGDHIRYLPGELARALIATERAAVHNQNGRVKAIRLLECAATHAQRIGEPTGTRLGVRFAVRERLDSGSTVWKHHPRCTYPAPE
jgi:hypothetical protein